MRHIVIFSLPKFYRETDTKENKSLLWRIAKL